MAADPLVLAYLAGVIDSDGYITIHRSTRNGKTYHAARIGISGTSREPHDLAASLWGGTVSTYTPKDSTHRAQFQWSRTGDAAAEIIAAVEPYLRVKAEHAYLALSLQEHVVMGRGADPFPWFGPDYDPSREREGLRTDISALMTRGRKAAGRLLDGRTWNEMPGGNVA